MEAVLVLDPLEVVLDEPDGLDIAPVSLLIAEFALEHLASNFILLQDGVLEGGVEHLVGGFGFADFEAVSG